MVGRTATSRVPAGMAEAPSAIVTACFHRIRRIGRFA